MDDNKKFKKIMSKFNIYGDYVKTDPFGKGHINYTYKVLYNQSGSIVPYILQKINTDIFPDPHAVTENIKLVTDHQKKYYKDHHDSSRRHLTPVKSKAHKYLFEEDNGDCWRVFFCIESAVTYEIMRDREAAYKAAKAFGEFQKTLLDLPGEELKVVIPDFHNTPKRFEALDKAIENDVADRVKDVQDEINFVMDRRKDAGVLVDMYEKGKIPERIVHNDTKLNNIMFDIHSDEPICVIDLDIVMPGFMAYDFGDMVRTATSPAEEDEKDISKVTMQFPIFKSLVKGFLETLGDSMSHDEKKSLVYGAYIIALEMIVRFLSDHINNDIYFRVHREGHNLDRARTQIALLKSIEQQWEKMCKYIERF
ncbi:MAG: aminoglycoside phosphotransferase family protein [bacterium]|nr:aminoglycoside phosphotransferase family protein [bacterium]